jgi:hypothetical protein
LEDAITDRDEDFLRALELCKSQDLEAQVKKLAKKLNKGKEKDPVKKEKRAVLAEVEVYTNTILEYHEQIDKTDGGLEEVVFVDEWREEESGWPAEEDVYASDADEEADVARYSAEFDAYGRTLTEIGLKRCRACFRGKSTLRSHPLAAQLKLPEEACLCQECYMLCTSIEVAKDTKDLPGCFFCGCGELQLFHCPCSKNFCEGCARANFGAQQYAALCKQYDDGKWECPVCTSAAPNVFLSELDRECRAKRGDFGPNTFISRFFELDGPGRRRAEARCGQAPQKHHQLLPLHALVGPGAGEVPRSSLRHGARGEFRQISDGLEGLDAAPLRRHFLVKPLPPRGVVAPAPPAQVPTLRGARRVGLV